MTIDLDIERRNLEIDLAGIAAVERGDVVTMDVARKRVDAAIARGLARRHAAARIIDLEITMSDIPPFNADDPKTVHDILWAWSTGSLSESAAIRLLKLDADDDLLQIAADNGVPAPRRPVRAPAFSLEDYDLQRDPGETDEEFEARRRLFHGPSPALRVNVHLTRSELCKRLLHNWTGFHRT